MIPLRFVRHLLNAHNAGMQESLTKHFAQKAIDLGWSGGWMSGWWLVLVTFVLVIWVVIDTLRWGISPMPTMGRARQAMLQALPSDLDGVIVEMGAGWGGLAIGALQRCPRGRVVAYEAAWIPWAVGWLRSLRWRGRLRWERADFFTATWPNETQAVLCYLYPGAMRRLADELPRRLPEGTWVISHAFALPRWKPEKTLILPDLFRTPLYVYRIPAQQPAA